MDLMILEWIQTTFANTTMDAFFKGVTALGDHGLLWILVCIGLVLRKQTRLFGLVLGGVLLVELGVVEGFIKLLVGRERPYLAHDFTILIKAPSGSSFPSGHAASSFAAATYLFMKNRRWGAVALVMAFLIGFSRLYLFVHYPSDVLVGALLGSALGYLGYKLYVRYFEAIDLGSTPPQL